MRVLAILAACLVAAVATVGCGSSSTVEPSNPSPKVTRLDSVPGSETPVYSINSDESEGMPTNRRRFIDLTLRQKVSAETLRKIASELKSKETQKNTRTLIFVYLPQLFPEAVRRAWATAHFDPDLKVEILGLTDEQVRILKDYGKNLGDKLIGRWIVDKQLGGLYCIYEVSGAPKFKKFSFPLIEAYPESEMIELRSNTGRVFQVKGSSEKFLIDDAGSLRLQAADGEIFGAARR